MDGMEGGLHSTGRFLFHGFFFILYNHRKEGADMAKISFDRIVSEFTVLNPFNNFQEELHRVEVRKDPLLGDVSIYNPYLKDKAKFFFGENDHELIRTLAVGSAPTCIFCPERVAKNTAQYPSSFLPEGRIQVGEATLFANLFSIGAYHPVIALSRTHFLKLSEFSPGLLKDGLTAARQFLNMVYQKDSSACFTTVNANYLLPAGASLVHPHMQMLITPVPYSYQARLLAAGQSYFDKNGSGYFHDLIEEEKRTKERYIASKGKWHWLTAFSPIGTNEVMAVHEDAGDFGMLTETDLESLARGISGVLSFYEKLGHLSFNFSLFSVRNAPTKKSIPCMIKMITRQNLCPNYRNDDYFLQKMLQAELIFNLPEELAEILRDTFSLIP
jgi:UDPglucose--hexose-1-phosphate uridylyltransferase